MPSKKRKYNARFPAGRIKKIMQTDEEVGKVAQAVPIIIFGPTPRTLELFVESLLKQAMQVTVSRNAKTLSPSHVKQCILAEARFDFLKDLVKNIPDVSAAEEKEIMSGESSPNALRFPDASRRLVREDSNSSSSCDVRVHQSKETLRRAVSLETEVKPRIETVTSTSIAETAIDLTKKRDDPPRMANFYQETLTEVQQRSVITVNPTYNSPQPSTSSFATLTPVQPVPSLEMAPKDDRYYVDLNIRQNNNITKINAPLASSVTPILNIDFSKNFANPEIKVLDTAVANMVGVKNERPAKVQRQNSRKETKREVKIPQTVDIDNINSGNLQIDEDYDT